jgi:MinD-like ATPase involved in chromosome partitioning or flagellar assembly
VTTNNDTPQVFSDGPADAEPYGSWFGWEAEAEPASDHGYPRPSFYPGGQDYPPEPESPGYSDGFGYPREPGYPRGPGYAPLPPDHPGPGELGYPAGPGYAPDSGYGPDAGYVPDAGYAHNPGYPYDGWNERAPVGPVAPAGPSAPLDPRYLGYAPDQGYERDADTVPPMEPLDAGHADLGYRADQAPWPGVGLPYRPESGFPGAPEMPGVPGWITPSRSAPQAPAETPGGLTTQSLLHGKRSASGWRHRIFRVTGGLLRLGESAADMRRRDLINRVRTPVAGGHHRVAVLSLKGGVGKTTTAVGLGATFGTLRGDRVIAVDANPDRGTLSDKVRLETAATIRDLLNERDQIRRYADVRAFTTQAPSRLEVLASDRDPTVSVAFSADDYCDAAQVLEHFYSICLTDCGTGLLHSAMAGVLALADQIVVVSSPSVDGARSASATLDWLEAHGCGDLVRNGVVVLSTIRPTSKSTVDLDRLERHFAARCRAVARIPYDPHLEEGAEVDLELLTAETADAYLTLAALVGDGLAWPRQLTSRAGLP